MINKFVNTLRDDLGLVTYINQVTHISGVKLGAKNIANLPSGASDIDLFNLIVTIIRIEEESILKNFPNKKMVNINGSYQADKRYPKIHLNYYLMFSAILQYDMAVATIERTIKFFQNTKKIRFEADGEVIELNMEIYSPSFEQLNNIWGMLGGKHLPNVIYKARVVSFDKGEQKLSPVIKTVGGTLKHE